MSLNIRHYHTSGEATFSGEFIVIDESYAAAAKFARLFVKLDVDGIGTPSTVECYDVLYVREVGCQYGGMERGFHERFAADLAVVDRRSIEAMYDLATLDSRTHFKTFFLDNWDDDRSVVIVSR